MSPTMLRTRNLRVVIYPNDHDPPHVHVIAPDAEAKFELSDLECIYSRGFSKKALKQIHEFLAENKELLEETWYDYHQEEE